MRFATVIEDGGATVVVVDERRILPLAGAGPGLDSVRGLAASGAAGQERVRDWARAQPARRYRSLHDVELGPAVPDPGAIYTIGLNYAAPGDEVPDPARPLVYAKLPTSVSGHGALLSLGPVADGQRRSGGRARRGHRRHGDERPAGGCPGARLRLHLHQRHLVARPVAGRRPVAAGQVVRRFLPGRALGGHAGRGDRTGCPARMHHQRHTDPGRHHRPHAPSDRRRDRLPQPPHRAAAGGS